MRSLITPLIDKYSGPILVIGGGPSAIKDLHWLRDDIGLEPACVLSANGHATKQDVYQADYIVCVDDKHSELKVPMESTLRPLGLPIITEHWWGDYRPHDMQLAVNSGQMAMAVGVLLGGAPVISVGMDCWQGDTYFHDPNVKVACSNRPLAFVSKQLRKLKDWCGDRNVIRPVSGPMVGMFQKYRPEETFENLHPFPRAKRMLEPKCFHAKATRGTKWRSGVVPAGAEFICSANEARDLARAKSRYRMELRELDSGEVPTVPSR